MKRLSILLLFIPAFYAFHFAGTDLPTRADTTKGDTTEILIRPMGTHPWLPTEPGGPSGPTIPTPFDPGDIPGKGDITFPPDSNRLAWANYYPDTIGYLIDNFGNSLNKRKYIGQPFEKVINAYQLPIKYCMTLPQGEKAITGAWLQYVNADDAVKYSFRHRQLAYVVVTFHDTIYVERRPIFMENSPLVETEGRKVAMKMKDAIVADIEVQTFDYNP